MLGALRALDDAGVHDSVFHVFLERLAAFFDDARHTRAVLASHLFIKQLEHALESGDVALRLFEMRLEGFAELVIRGGLRQFWQCLGQLLFSVVKISDLIHERFAEIISSHVFLLQLRERP